MTRLTRLLLRLYPRRFRCRYQGELLGLIGELRTRGEISRGRLLQDLVRGALSTRRLTRRASAVAVTGVAVTAVAVLLATGALSIGRTSPARDPKVRAQVLHEVPRVTVPQPSPGTCFVGGTLCSLSACAQFAGGRPTGSGAARDDAPSLIVTQKPRSVTRKRHLRAHARCVTDPRLRRAHTVFVRG